MAPATHVALIRGINVGGKNPVPMARLRAVLEDRGMASTRTYIQSGNVVLDAPHLSVDEVVAEIEFVLSESFGVDTVVVVVDSATLLRAVFDAPPEFGDLPDLYHYDVAFLRPGLSGADALAAFGIRDGVDAAWDGDGVVYFRRLSAERTRSRMSKVVGTPQYRDMTIRNWRTTTTLAAMVGMD